jgi:ubiquinone/menaquinone biosynthesis C-methylase UbiE
MTKQRVSETDHGIVGEFNVSMYDQMQRNLRDRGWIETKALLKSGIARGRALEVGSGPGYLGLEWLKSTQDTSLTGLDISPDMIALAHKNAGEYGLEDRVRYVNASGSRMPFKDGSFDAVFTNGSLHEWADPRATFNEIWRVLRAGGRYFISDLRRDMPALLHWFMRLNAKPKEMRPGLDSSIGAAYTPTELAELVKETGVEDCKIESIAIGVMLSGAK